MKAAAIDMDETFAGRRLMNTVPNSQEQYVCWINAQTGAGHITQLTANSIQCSTPGVFSECVCGQDVHACSEWMANIQTGWQQAGCSGKATSKKANCYASTWGLASLLDATLPSCNGCSTSQCTSYISVDVHTCPLPCYVPAPLTRLPPCYT